ncbi:hypothetical protein QTP88_015189 [Uroleucon formosanum]
MPNEDNFVSDSQIDNQIQDAWDTSKIWPALWTKEQVIELQKKNSWLSSKNGKLGCNNCIQAKNSINFQKSNIDSKVRISSEWVGFEIVAAGCNRTNQLASLRNKIKQHSESKAHVLAENILKKSSDKVLDKMFERISEVEIDSNTRLFRTVYCLVKNHRPFKQFEELVQLQQINGLDMGSSLHSRITATRMVNVIAKEMRKRLILRLIQSNSKFTIMIDESTTLSTKCTLILYISSYFDVESPVVAFLDLIELDRQDAETIEKSIWLSLECNGISTSFALNNWIAFASDGASVMTESSSFLEELGLFYDVLSELAMLSCILQSRKTTLMRAQSEINRTIRILESLKAEPGEKEKEIIEAIQKGIHKGVNITTTKSGGINRMRQRLFDDSKNKTMLEDIQVIDEVFKVATNDAKGEDEVKRVSRTLGFSEFESVVDFRSRNVFSSFMKALNILPTSTADCERGFSDMNLTITDLRTSLNIENVSGLMFISINGPSVADFNPRPYIKIWLRDHRSAVSTPRGKERKEIDDENKMQKLFFNNLFN